MRSLVLGLQKHIPGLYFAGIIASYLFNALVIGFALAPVLSQIPGIASGAGIFLSFGISITFQFFRFLIVSTPFLTDYKDRKGFIYTVAGLAAVGALFELGHLLSSNLTGGEFWGAMLSLSFLIVGGFILEVLFVDRADALLANIYKKAAEGKGERRSRYEAEAATATDEEGNILDLEEL